MNEVQDSCRDIRETLGLTQGEAAERVGVSQARWSRWESGVYRPGRYSTIMSLIALWDEAWMVRRHQHLGTAMSHR
jgi:predicted transcriptional regulator